MLNKKEDIEVFIREKNVDILGLGETWLDETITNDTLAIPGYKIFRSDRNRSGGGVLFYYSESLSCESISISAPSIECVWLKLKLRKITCIVGNVYRPPNSNSQYIDNLLDMIEQVFQVSENVILVGDLNYDCLPPKISPEITNIESLFGMYQLVRSATRITPTSKTLLDVILTNSKDLLYDTDICEIAASDHYPVITHVRIDQSPIDTSSHNVVCFRDFKCFNENEYISDLCDALNEHELLNVHVSQPDITVVDPIVAWECFKNAFIQVSNKHAPFKTMRLKRKHCPWVTHNIVRIMHKRDHAHKKAVRNKCSAHWDEYKVLKNRVTTEIRNEKKKYFQTRFNQNSSDPKKMWKSINDVLCNKHHDPPPKDITANDFNQFFSTIGKDTIAANITVDTLNSEVPWKNPPCLYKFNFSYVQSFIVSSLITKLSSESSCDVLGFDARLLHLSNDFITPVITLIVNASLFHGTLPPDWKFSRVTPVYKGKGAKSECTNYRPISVISHIGKIVEKIIQKQLLTYLISHDLINIDQSAFRPRHSTQTALHRVVDTWLENISDGLMTGVCFFDIRKCFDTIDHGILLQKLQFYGIYDTELNWFSNYLSRRQQVVKHMGLSNKSTVDVGVPQGSVLGPILFLLFVNDISQFVSTGVCNLYADDAVFYCQGKTAEEVQTNLQCCVSNVHEWYCKNRLSLNAKKCQVMMIKSKFSAASDLLDISIDDTTLDQVKCAKYLGLDIDNILCWNDYVSVLVKKISFKLYQLRRVRSVIPQCIAEKIYLSTIQPCIDYAISVWGQTSEMNMKRVQRVQNYAARLVLCNYDYVNFRGVELVKNLNWMNVHQRCTYFTCILMFKCINGLAPSYLCDDFVFNVDVNSYTTRSHPMNVIIPLCHNKSFKTKGSMCWNRLPAECKDAPSIHVFKKKLKSFMNLL